MLVEEQILLSFKLNGSQNEIMVGTLRVLLLLILLNERVWVSINVKVWTQIKLGKNPTTVVTLENQL